MTHLLHVRPLLFEPGDRMSREEFLARWERMPELKSAELIDGVVYMPSPVSPPHARRDHQMQLLVGNYAARIGFCEVLSNGTWLMADSAPQPDIAMRLLPPAGTEDSGELASGAPELVVEIAASSRSFDLGPKLSLYQRAGVAEYVVVLLEEGRVEWRLLEEGRYRLLQPDEQGISRSNVFPGLWLDERALWAGDRAKLLATLDAGLRSPECIEFASGKTGR